MKAVILAGGLGTRISEETAIKPKPMVEVGGRPLLWHILKIYSSQGINDFIVCLGYKGFVIKEFFSNYFLHTSDVCFNMRNNRMTVLHKSAEPWRVTLVDTGMDTMTGGRIRRVRPYIGREPFHLTYGDGVSDVSLAALAKQHRAQKALVTLTAVRSPSRFGNLSIQGGKATEFREKSVEDGAWISGGFFFVEPKALDFIADDSTRWEAEPLSTIAAKGALGVLKHSGFWQSMDTLRDKNLLEDLWQSGRAPWKKW